MDADTVVFDDELTPAQQRNLERILGRTAIDRTAVILDIFAQNAHTQEGRAQVELALQRYRLPRLRGMGLVLSQQAGGIGTRGPGETQLEVDRRRIMRRIRKLEVELRELESTRRTQRRARKRGALRTVSLVGYTNAGKSSSAQCLHRCRRARRGQAVLHARSEDPASRPARRRVGAVLGHRRFRAQAAPPARGRLPRHPRGRRLLRPPRARGRRLRSRSAGADRSRTRRPHRDRGRRGARAPGVQQGRSRPAQGGTAHGLAPRFGGVLGPHGPRSARVAPRRRRPAQDRGSPRRARRARGPRRCRGGDPP